MLSQFPIEDRVRQKSALAMSLLDQTESAELTLLSFIDTLVLTLKKRRATVAMEMDNWRSARQRVRQVAAVRPASVRELSAAETTLDNALSAKSDWAVAFSWDESEAAALSDHLLRVLKLECVDATAPRVPKEGRPGFVAALSAACLPDWCFVIGQQPDGTSQAYYSRASNWLELKEFNVEKAGRADLSRAVCVRVCAKLQLALILIVNQTDSCVIACKPDGQLMFGIGSEFECNYQLGVAEDVLSTGSLLVVCSPQHGLLFVPMSDPMLWRDAVDKKSASLNFPIRLAWSREKQTLFVLDEVVFGKRYRMQAFDVNVRGTLSSSLSQLNSTACSILSATRPCVQVSELGLLLGVTEAELTKILLLGFNCASIVGTVKLNLQHPLNDLFYIGRSLGVCSGSDLILPDNVKRLRPEGLRGESPSPAVLCHSVEDAGISVTHLSGLRFVLELEVSLSSGRHASYSIRVCGAPEKSGDQPSRLRLIHPNGEEILLRQPACIRACCQTGQLIIADQLANHVLVCSQDGRVNSVIGPSFSCRSRLSQPSDAVSTGDLHVICCPDTGLFLASMAEPSDCKFSIKKHNIRLRRPVRLAWSDSRQLLIVVDEVADRNYAVCTFSVVKNPRLLPTSATLMLLAGPSDAFFSLADPCAVSCSGGAILLSASGEEGTSDTSPRLLTTSADCASIGLVDCDLPTSGVVTDLCWIDRSLWLCCSGRIISIPVRGREKASAYYSG